jgi:tetratricopeptide (TPR) repeat protein
MKTPVITIFVVSVMIIGIFLIFYDYKKHGLHETPIGISRSQAEAVKKARIRGEDKVKNQDYLGAINDFSRASKMLPKDPYIHNDLGAAYYEFGMRSINPPVPPDEDIGYGNEVDARFMDNKEEVFAKLKEALDMTISGVVTIAVNNQPLSKEINDYIKPMNHYIHIEEEVKDDGGKDYWITILKGPTKDYFLNAEAEYIEAINLLSVRDTKGRKYSSYPVASRNLGTLYHRMGRRKEALENWQRALQLEPSDQDLKRLVDSFRKD